MSDLFSGGHTGLPAERPFEGRFSMVVITWVANPFRGDLLETTWQPAAEAVTKYGARAWAWTRSKDDPLTFMQYAVFENKTDFERYWLSDEIAAARVEIAGLYQIPILPVWFECVDWGIISDSISEVESQVNGSEAA
jgi:hypothetical protein